ncbi:MAG: efflux RND transporter periplasmic adaptor subunit [Geothrix sp.]|uniref:efflux RND transporter periplasmic adaptor subunit n=1 Tax=Geothrix sp. TaxID=1962974 RepID=UPI00185EB87D|nr:efflux RND transporter periplasmic adaptor subunit [Geothrix sp.]NWJ39405.1 efflux RND transporter periplasmic adaptor subunit [Geothrix sp.]WIL19370.1 MAG: efflux RND transporter periplasmic adaptor subunit [Geothrix sp.]
MQKRWVILSVAGAAVAAGMFFTLKGSDGKSKKAEANTPFRLGKVQAEDLQVSVREVGVVDPLTKVDVKSTVSGRIVGLKVREGALVRAGEMLAEVEPDVNQAQTLSDVQGSVSQARVSFKNAERDFNQQAELFKAGLISDQTFRGARTARDLAEEAYKSAQTRYQIVEDRGIPISGNASTQLARVTAPMNGVVIKKGVELGDTITSGVSSFNAGTVVFTVADLKSLIVKVNLNEVDIAKVRVGQPVRITLDAYPQRAFTGKVRFVAPAADLVEKIKVFKVEVALDELTDDFKTGMSANVEILGEKRDKAVSVPLEALQRRDGQTVVYRLKENLPPQDIAKAKDGLTGRGKFIWLADHWKEYFDVVSVKAGIATLERVEILSGLKANDQVSLEDPSKKKVEKDDENN